jgi:CDP-glucose 4,6-dehydratase
MTNINHSNWLNAYANKRVLVTGHTGFKGAWLCEWLLGLGAEVHGWALPPQKPSLFAALDLAQRTDHLIGDILDLAALNARMREVQPHFIFHLAAQSLVRVSYREPLLTFSTNILGTAKLLEAVRAFDFPCTVVAITTDKCYENDGRARSFRESDPLGGHDPYSASKAGAELAVAAYRDSFFRHDCRVALASARAGNVVGGGDWAEDRIVPDCVRSLSANQAIPVRNPDFTRPWQHVLEPLGGYLLLGARLEAVRSGQSVEEIARCAQAFNFGPEPDANRSVRDLVGEVLRHWPGKWEHTPQENHLKEAPLLSLAIDKAKETLGWQPRWNFAETVEQTMVWYREYFARAQKSDTPSMIDFTQKQIAAYLKTSTDPSS